MGLEIPIAWLTVLLFGSLALLLALGLPMAFCTGSLAVIFLFVFGTPAVLNMMPSRIFPFMTDYQLSAVPLFIFMAAILEKAGIIEELFDVIYKWLGSLKGGLASATVVACTLLAAMVGVVGATEVTMGMIALPAMLRRGYDPKLACGSLLAGGTLGILIPPSVMAIVYAVVAQQSLGELLIGSVFPGLLLSGMYVLYITIRCYVNPSLGPALPIEERVDLREKFRLLRNTIAPIMLILLVLGVIFFGVATPVEAAGIGTFGALAVCALHGRLNWINIEDAAMATLKATAMVMWIFFGATMFVGFFIVKGGQTFVAESILGTGLGPYGILLLMMVILFVLGMFLDWVGILLLTVPIFVPILTALSFGGVLGIAGRQARRHLALVRRHLHRQHADGVPQPAVRLLAVLSEERRAAADQHGDDLQVGGAVHRPAGDVQPAVHRLPADHPLAAEQVLRGALTRRRRRPGSAAARRMTESRASSCRPPALNLVFPHTFVPWFRTVAPHIHAYHGKTFVVAIAGELIAAGKLASFAQDLAILQAMGIKIVLVHGFRPQVNEQLRSKGHASRYSHGMRITDQVALDSAQEAAGQLRFEIEAAFSQGLPNTPMANAIVRVVSGNFLTAQPVGVVDGVDFMHSGVVRKVDAVAIRRAIDIGAMLLLSPFGFSPTGEAFNLTMEDVATSTAIALQADKLLFVTEVPGIHEDPADPGVADRHRARPGRRREAARRRCRRRWCRPTPRSTCATACAPVAAASSARTSCRSRSTARC